MSWHNYFKAKSLIKRGEVKLEGASTHYFFLKVKDYDVRIPKSPDLKANCTCQSGSIWRVGKICSHIKASELFLEKKDEIIKG